jgi:hypothetical protein
MRYRVSRYAAVCVLALSAACGGGPSGPSGPSAASYAGEWTGTTSQGTPLTFTVSPERTVTRITVGYNFEGCSGTATYATAVAIQNVPTAPVPVGSAIYDSGRDSGNRVLISFLLTSNNDAHGVVIFSEWAGCGSTVANAPWTAAKH